MTVLACQVMAASGDRQALPLPFLEAVGNPFAFPGSKNESARSAGRIPQRTYAEPSTAYEGIPDLS